MYFCKRNQKYSFIYYDSEKKTNIRLKNGECPHFLTDAEAQTFCQKWNEVHLSAKSVARKRLRWKALAPEFAELLSIFETIRKEEAPFSWKTSSYYLSCYVFPYFIETARLNLLKDWPRNFEKFRNQLLTTSRIHHNRDKDALSYSTMNAVIKALNTFMLTCSRHSYIDPVAKCRMFEKWKENEKTEECIISPMQAKEMFRLMAEQCLASAEMFWVSLHTGMRVGELLGLSLPDFSNGAIENDVLNKCLESFALKAYGYFTLDSQPFLSLIRDEKKEVPRKPLKGKKKISGANSRTIPIFNQRAYDMLVSLWNKQRALFASRAYGSNPRNYLLFNGLNRALYYKCFMMARRMVSSHLTFTPHDSRHTYSTWLAETSGANFALCRMILGHSSLATTYRYVHMAERIQIQLRSKIQLQLPMSPSKAVAKTIPLFGERAKMG